MTMPNSRTRHVGQALDDDAHRLLTVRDAARLLNVTVAWVYEHIRDDARDRLPALKLGKYVRFDRRDLSSYVDAKRERAHMRALRR